MEDCQQAVMRRVGPWCFLLRQWTDGRGLCKLCLKVPLFSPILWILMKKSEIIQPLATIFLFCALTKTQLSWISEVVEYNQIRALFLNDCVYHFYFSQCSLCSLCLQLKGARFPSARLSVTARQGQGCKSVQQLWPSGLSTLSSHSFSCAELWGHLNLAARISDLADL